MALALAVLPSVLILKDWAEEVETKDTDKASIAMSVFITNDFLKITIFRIISIQNTCGKREKGQAIYLSLRLI
jgi:hypothetical protein